MANAEVKAGQGRRPRVEDGVQSIDCSKARGGFTEQERKRDE